MIDDLYDLIVGQQTVWASTESFFRKVLADDTIRHFFEGVDIAHLRARQSMFCLHASRRTSCRYGKDILAAHAHAREQVLNDEHFDRFLSHFVLTSILRGKAAAATGAVISNTPFTYSAVSFSTFTPSGSVSVRSNTP
jgi:hemoglobin